MGDGHRLAKMMREAGRTPQNEVVDIVEGEVTSVSPLKVKVDNRELTEAFLILGTLCQETFIPSDYIINVNPEIEKIRLWRGLNVGDKVMMIKLARGQKYYILQRMEGVKP